MSNKIINRNRFLMYILLFMFLTNIFIYFNVSFLREIFSFIFLTVLPGLIIISILRLNKLNFIEKFVLSWGISLSLVTFAGLLINNLVTFLGYTNALSLDVLLMSFDVIIIILALVNYVYNKKSYYSIPALSLTKKEWIIILLTFWLVPLSIMGVITLENTNNNIMLMFLFLLIPVYVSLIIVFRDKFPKKLYPFVIFFIGLSILIIMSLRSSHIMGVDIHAEFNIFYKTLINNYWGISKNPTLTDACVFSTLLPAIYQRFLNISPELLYKYFFVLLFSITPLLIYLSSNKYVKKEYAFLAAFFFISQLSFFTAESNPRTNMAVLFVMLAIMVFFNDRIALLQKRFLFVMFLISCVLSHYSTSYIFFIILLFTFIVNFLFKRVRKLRENYSVNTLISSNIIILFFTIMFFWYAQVTGQAFTSGIGFFKKTFSDILFNFFISESRGTQVQALTGQGILGKTISSQIEFALTWALIGLIVIGIIAVFIYRDKIIFNDKVQFDFLKHKIDFEFYLMAVASLILLVAIVVIPYVAEGYSMDRLYLLTSTFLSLFFVIGAFAISGIWGKIRNIKINKDIVWIVNNSPKKPIFLILLILLPYFLCVSGFAYNILGDNKSVLSNNNINSYYESYITDGESFSAKWLGEHRNYSLKIRADHNGAYRMYSQGYQTFETVDENFLKKKDFVKGYIYLRGINIIQGVFVWNKFEKDINKTAYDSYYDTVYDSGDSEILFNQN